MSRIIFSDPNDYTITINDDLYQLQAGEQSCFFEPTWFTTKKAPEGEN
jgi:hypothetical protein